MCHAVTPTIPVGQSHHETLIQGEERLTPPLNGTTASHRAGRTRGMEHNHLWKAQPTTCCLLVSAPHIPLPCRNTWLLSPRPPKTLPFGHWTQAQNLRYCHRNQVQMWQGLFRSDHSPHSEHRSLVLYPYELKRGFTTPPRCPVGIHTITAIDFPLLFKSGKRQ